MPAEIHVDQVMGVIFFINLNRINRWFTDENAMKNKIVFVFNIAKQWRISESYPVELWLRPVHPVQETILKL